MTGPLAATYFYRHKGQKFPRKKYVLELHDDVLEVSEGRSGVAHIGVIESAVHKPVTSLMGEDVYPTFLTKVAAIDYTLAHDPGFSDGNKRTVLVVMLNTLEANEFYLIQQTARRLQRLSSPP